MNSANLPKSKTNPVFPTLLLECTLERYRSQVMTSEVSGTQHYSPKCDFPSCSSFYFGIHKPWSCYQARSFHPLSFITGPGNPGCLHDTLTYHLLCSICNCYLAVSYPTLGDYCINSILLHGPRSVYPFSASILHKNAIPANYFRWHASPLCALNETPRAVIRVSQCTYCDKWGIFSR